MFYDLSDVGMVVVIFLKSAYLVPSVYTLMLCIHLSNVLTDHLNILTYIKAWLLLTICIIPGLRTFILKDIHQISLQNRAE